MKTSSFLAALRAHASLPLVFRAGRETVSPGYHLTEVKRVAYETMDCGAMTHRWAESQFELWVPAGTAGAAGRGHLPAEKFLRIVDRVEAALPLHDAATVRIHASFAGQPAALYEVEAVSAAEGKLWIELGADRTRCKAAERRVAASSGGCCGTPDDNEEGTANEAGCGGGSGMKSVPATAAVCCA